MSLNCMLQEEKKSCFSRGLYEECERAVEGAAEKAEELGIQRPYVIGVTELTSLNDGDLEEQGLRIKYDDLVMRRTNLAKKWGLDGVVSRDG